MTRGVVERRHDKAYELYLEVGKAVIVAGLLQGIYTMLTSTPGTAEKLDLEKLHKEVVEILGYDPLQHPKRRIGDYFTGIIKGVKIVKYA